MSIIEIKKLLMGFPDLILEKQSNGKIIIKTREFVNAKSKFILNHCPRPIILPTVIKIDQNLLEVMGLYFGDGTKSLRSTSKRYISFTNYSPKLHLLVISFLEKLGVKRNGLRVLITLNEKYKNKIDIEKLGRKWSRTLKIPLDNFYKPYFAKYKKQSDNKTKEPIKTGTSTIFYHRKLFKLFFIELLSLIKKLLFLNPKFRVPFIRGLIATDGSIDIKGNIISLISISNVNKNEKNFIKKLLALSPIFINSQIYRHHVRFSGYKNYKIVKKYRLCDLHPVKRIKFENAFSSLEVAKYVPGKTKEKIINYLKYQKEKQTNEIARALNLNIPNTRKHLNELSDVIIKIGMKNSNIVWGVKDRDPKNT